MVTIDLIGGLNSCANAAKSSRSMPVGAHACDVERNVRDRGATGMTGQHVPDRIADGDPRLVASGTR
jgi:hypothetical protein